jgi:hypothetical protein
VINQRQREMAEAPIQFYRTRPDKKVVIAGLTRNPDGA